MVLQGTARSGDHNSADVESRWRTGVKAFRPAEGSGIDNGIRERRRSACMAPPEEIHMIGDPLLRLDDGAADERELLHVPQDGEDFAATRVQSCWRGMRARREAREIFEAEQRRRRNRVADEWLTSRERLASLLSHAWRAYSARRKFLAALALKRARQTALPDVCDVAAMHIQRRWRAHRARRNARKRNILCSTLRQKLQAHAISSVRFAIKCVEEEDIALPAASELFLTTVQEAVAACVTKQPRTSGVFLPSGGMEEVRVQTAASVADDGAEKFTPLGPENLNPVFELPGQKADADDDNRRWESASDWSVSTPASDVNEAISDIPTDEEVDHAVAVCQPEHAVEQTAIAKVPDSQHTIAGVDSAVKDQSYLVKGVPRPENRQEAASPIPVAAHLGSAEAAPSIAPPALWTEATESVTEAAEAHHPEMPAHVAAALAERLDRLTTADFSTPRQGRSKEHPQRNRMGRTKLLPDYTSRQQDDQGAQVAASEIEPWPPPRRRAKDQRQRGSLRVPGEQRLGERASLEGEATQQQHFEADKKRAPPALLPKLARAGIKAEALMPALGMKRTELSRPRRRSSGRRMGAADHQPLPWLPMRYKLAAADRRGRHG